MFTPFDHEDIDLTDAITRVHSRLNDFEPETDEYRKATEQLTKLYALRNQTAQLNLQSQQTFASHQLAQDNARWQEEQDELPFYKRVDPNTLLVVAGNIFIGLAVVKYEQTGVIATKVQSFMRKI